MKTVQFNLSDDSEKYIMTHSDDISEELGNDEFQADINNRGENTFYYDFQEYLTSLGIYCDIEDLSSGGAEPYNEDEDGEVIIHEDGLVENWFYNFWMPETAKTNGQSETPLRVKLKGYFYVVTDYLVFFPIEMTWNEDDL